jgi:acyl transferase domain-containing protein/acyl carrier protein
LVQELARVLDVSPQAITTSEPFSRFGLDSAKAVGILSRLGELLCRKIPATAVWTYPTIDQLVSFLCDGPRGTAVPAASAPGPLSIGSGQIAVIGMACRFPGAPDIPSFWALLRDGRSAFRTITPDRWDIEAWYDPDSAKPGKMNARSAGLLDRIDEFDPGFFGISPREASQMDPQQRLALELAWEALEDAGATTAALRGSRTGVFVGVVWRDYESVARKAGAEITLHSGTGQASSIVANRISYALGLQGPSLALDTACSSSLVSVHLACRSLASGESSLAIAGGVNVILDPDTMVALSKFGGLSPTDRLCAFDARANGFVRGEGGGFVVLKSLSRALEDGDAIYAVIRGSAVNNDGASNGLTAPNPQAQEAVIAEAYSRAGIRPLEIDYTEAHGTGTPLGDPIEAQALANSLGRQRSPDRPLIIGAVKTNIGHLEGAAGVAGLIKLVLSIRHRQIPPSLNFQTPNPHIDFEASHLRVPKSLEPWPEPGKTAVGGVSAFGWGGTNCHVVVEEVRGRAAHLLPISADDEGALRTRVQRWRDYLNCASPTPSLRDLCAAAANRCAGRAERAAFTARSTAELAAQLDGFLLGQKRPGIATGTAVPTRPKLAFVFSPQGSQWLGMGRDLMREEPVFRAGLAECARALTALTGWSLFDQLLGVNDDARRNRVEFVQPALFSMQVALARLWQSWGIVPDFIAAHSLGEWAAACVAGALTLEEAMRVVVESSRAQAASGEDGGMAVVELAADEAATRIGQWPGDLSVAGCNSPTSTIISGDSARLKALVAAWKEEGILCSLIDVDVAAHSPRMGPVLDGLEASLAGLEPTRVGIPFVSSATGDFVRGSELGPRHWAHHLRQPVRFAQAIERLARQGCTVFLEISPHPLLLSGIEQTLKAAGIAGQAFGSCRRGDHERSALLNTLGGLYAVGCPVEWAAVAGGESPGLRLPIELAPEPAAGLPAPGVNPALILPLSGHSAPALSERAGSVACHLRGGCGVSVKDVAYTAAARRMHLEHRLAVVGRSAEELASGLEAFARGEKPASLASGRTHAGATPKVAFVCSGQGPQWWGMGRELFDSEAVFRRELGRCAEEMRHHVSWDLVEELSRDEANSRLGDTEIAQPALFALQVALAALWRSWGVHPQALVGHSVGEVAAACLGGILSFPDAVRVVCHRGRLMQRATGMGEMAAIELPEAELESLLGPFGRRISIAAVNSPTSTVVSGEAAAVEDLVRAAKERGARGKLLPVNYAFHSAQMGPFQTAMSEAVSGIVTNRATVPVFSTVSGALAQEQDFGPAYWGRNLRQTVRFAASTQAMLTAGIGFFIELSPQPVLSGMVAQCAEAGAHRACALASLRRGQPERKTMLETLGVLYANGQDIDWPRVCGPSGRVVPLPTYPWQRKRYWLDPGTETRGQSDSVVAPADWSYEVRWEVKPRSRPRTPAPVAPRQWILFADREGVAVELARRLRARGDRTLLVSAGPQFGSSEPGSLTINPRDQSHYRQLLGRAVESPGSPLAGVIHLWSLEVKTDDSSTISELEAAHRVGCESVLSLVQALGEREWAKPPGVWLVTQGAQPAGAANRPLALGQTPLWGLGRVLALEHPEFGGGAIDLAPGDDALDAAEQLVCEVCEPDGEDQIAFSAGKRYVARLVRGPELSAPPPRFRPEGCYLITGGLGKVGLMLARWMVRHGARSLVLVGRTAVPARSCWPELDSGSPDYHKVAQLQAIERMGAQVTVQAANVADMAAMTALFARFGKDLPPLKGVVHAAAVIELDAFRNIDAVKLERVLQPKVSGAWNLHQLTASLDLDFFAMFSSAASVWGSRELAHYAAANHFLDALAHHRRAAGLPALTVNWGWWEGGGTSDHADRFLEEFGLRRMPAPQALSAFGAMIESHRVQGAVAAVDWSVFKPIYEVSRRRPFLSGLRMLDGQGEAKPASQPVEGTELLRRVRQAGPKDAWTLLESHVKEQAALVLHLNAGDLDDVSQGFFKMGMDSLMTVELRSHLEKTLGQRLPATIAFEYPTIHALAGYLFRELREDAKEATEAKPAAPKPESPPVLASDTARLEEADLAAMLDEELARVLNPTPHLDHAS